MVAQADGSIIICTKLDNSGLEKGLNEIRGSLGGLKTQLSRLGAVVASAFSVAAIVSFGRASLAAASNLSDAMTGLNSVMTGQGRSFRSAQEFINKYTEDGLIPATNAITAYKNLALRGYDDSQIQQVMAALKDSAAFGRQASYTMGEAVQTATEGLKNENSILVDNAGVTKNVAKMWDEYAASIGTTANNLTQQQKIQAEVNGILEETRFQTGDAAKMSGQYSGQVAALAYNFNALKISVGNAIKPVVQAVLPAVNALISALTKVASLIAQITGALFGRATVKTNSLASSNAGVASSANRAAEAEKNLASGTKAAAREAKKSLAAFDEIQQLQRADSGASSGSGGSGTGVVDSGIGGGAIVAQAEVDDQISPQIQAIVDKIHELIEPLKQIDFTPLEESFDRLRQAVAPLTRELFSGLEWAWYNLFVPLAKWTIEGDLPAFLDLLASVCNVLSAALNALKPVGQWLWDNFLQPIAQWTGGLIVDILEAMADSFNDLAGFISMHEAEFQFLLTFLGAFAAGIAVVNGAMAVYHGWQTLCTAVTKGFGTAMSFLSSPIGIVVTAIAALIAIIVVLATHWDEVKEVAKQVWDSIREIWQNVCGWFDDHVMTPLRELWEGFSQAIRDIWDGITNTIKGAINSCIGFVNGLIGAVVAGINTVINALNKLNFTIPSWVPGLGGESFGFNIAPLTAPQIPMLAKGAVLPASKPFLAVLGDQTHGTNVEAPLATIQQAVAEVMEDVQAGQMAGFETLAELLRQLISAVYGIELTDEQVGRAAQRWQRKQEIMMGGAF